MVQTDCVFDPVKDLEEVIQEGYLSIADCLEHGVVPGDLAMSDGDEGNGIEDPSRISGHVRDVFHAERVRKSLAAAAAAAPVDSPSPERATE